MTRQAAYWRLFLICLAAAAGETAAAYVLTQDAAGPPGGRRGEIRYWRGRPVDDDRSRWN